MRRISILNKQIYYVCCGFPIITLMSLYRDIYIGLWDSNGLLLVQSLSELQAHLGSWIVSVATSGLVSGTLDRLILWVLGKKKKTLFHFKMWNLFTFLGLYFFFFLPFFFFSPFFFFLECPIQLCNSFELFNHLWIHHSEIVYEFVTQK